MFAVNDLFQRFPKHKFYEFLWSDFYHPSCQVSKPSKHVLLNSCHCIFVSEMFPYNCIPESDMNIDTINITKNNETLNNNCTEIFIKK